jgi:hypothetical protein
MVFQIIFNVTDVLGIFFNTGQTIFKVFLILWPVSNFIRFVNTLVVLIFRSKFAFRGVWCMWCEGRGEKRGVWCVV